jgi:hypothetical protein
VEAILSFAVLGLLVVAGAAAVNRAKRYLDGSDLRRETLASLTGLANADGLTAGERKAVASLIEDRMQRA